MTDAEQISWQRKVLREEPVSEKLKEKILKNKIEKVAVVKKRRNLTKT